MSSDCIIGLTTKGKPLTVGSRKGLESRSEDKRQRQRTIQNNIHHRYDALHGDSPQVLTRKGRYSIGLEALEHSEGVFDGAWPRTHIGIDEDQQLPRCFLRELIARPVLSRPSLRQRLSPHH